MEDATLASDIVTLRDLKVDALIGVYAWERRIRQRLHLNIEIATDTRRAAASDDIQDALNYKLVSQRVSSYVATSEFHLVEALAEGVTRLIREEFDVPWVRLTLTKQAPVQGATEIGVVIERGRRD